jgi:hypothetical protein
LVCDAAGGSEPMLLRIFPRRLFAEMFRDVLGDRWVGVTAAVAGHAENHSKKRPLEWQIAKTRGMLKRTSDATLHQGPFTLLGRRRGDVGSGCSRRAPDFNLFLSLSTFLSHLIQMLP